jgi:hypothetical protein
MISWVSFSLLFNLSFKYEITESNYIESARLIMLVPGIEGIARFLA